ncbi:MAG: hypothetical protein ACKVWR_18545 [Acidimicrobiales bacterium]
MAELGAMRSAGRRAAAAAALGLWFGVGGAAPLRSAEPMATGPAPVEAVTHADAAAAVEYAGRDGEAGAEPVAHLRRRSDEALGLVPYPWRERLPSWTIAFRGPRAGLLGAAFPGAQRIEVYVRPDQRPRDLALVIAHELGHAMDVSLLGPDDRRRWAVSRGIEVDAAWWAPEGGDDFGVGAGDLAETFAVWLVGGRSASRLGGPANPEQQALLAEFAARAAGGG